MVFEKKGTGQRRSRQKIVILSVFIFKILIQKKIFNKKIYLLKEKSVGRTWTVMICFVCNQAYPGKKNAF
jgi:hypothetical protein